MIGQYVFTRNDGSVFIGPHGNPSEGNFCVGRTDSVRQEDLVTLLDLSIFDGAVHKPGSAKDYIPHWTIRWLPSGALAVGKTTYFPPEMGIRARNNHIAHFYILDRETALQATGCMEQLFTLPFIDYDLTYMDQSRDMRILTRLQDYHTLQQAGAQNVEILPLNQLLDQYLPLYTDEIRYTLEAIIDSVAHRNRQMLFSYDCFAKNAEWVCAQWLGWIFRLLPLHIRCQTSVAFPFHPGCSDSVQLALIPDCLVRVINGSASYRNNDASDALTVPMGFNYLCAKTGSGPDVTFFHQYNVQAQLPELFRAKTNFFCAFLQKWIDDLYDAEDFSVNDQLQGIYGRLYQRGWHSQELLSHSASLELMTFSLGNVDSLMKLSPETYQNRLYAWMDQLELIIQCRALPESVCLEIQTAILDQMYSYVQTYPADRWLEVLQRILQAPLSRDMAAYCVDKAAIACAQIWDKGEKDALQVARDWFAQVSFDDQSVEQLIFMQLMTEGDEVRQAAWKQAGTSCDAETASRRISKHVLSLMGDCANTEDYFRNLESAANLFEKLPFNLLDTIREQLVRFTDDWLRQGHVSADIAVLEDLYAKLEQTELSATNFDSLKNSLIQTMVDYCKMQVRMKYQNAGLPELREVKALWQSVVNPRLRQFCFGLYQDLLDRVRDELHLAPLSENLIRQGIEVLDICDDIRSWNLYNEICARSLGLLRDDTDEPFTVPAFVTPHWLAELHADNCLRFSAGCRAANIICAMERLLSGEKISEQLGQHLGREELPDIQCIRATLYRDGRYEFPHRILFNLCQNSAVSGLITADALVLLTHYPEDSFPGYLKWLVEHGKGNEYLKVLETLCADRHLLRSLKQDQFLKIMRSLNCTYYDCGDVIPDQDEDRAVDLSRNLWQQYMRDKSLLQRLRKKQFVLDYSDGGGSRIREDSLAEQPPQQPEPAPREEAAAPAAPPAVPDPAPVQPAAPSGIARGECIPTEQPDRSGQDSLLRGAEPDFTETPAPSGKSTFAKKGFSLPWSKK